MTERMSLLKSIKDLFVRLDENHGQQIAKITRDFFFKNREIHGEFTAPSHVWILKKRRTDKCFSIPNQLPS